MPVAQTQNTFRPKLTIERTPAEITLEILSVITLFWSYYYLLNAWSSMPDRIPTHFGFDGAPNAWGSKMTLLLTPAIVTIMFASLTLLSRFPHIYNYPWQLTEQNAETQYRLARTLLTAIKMEVTLLFSFIEYGIIRTSMGKSQGLGFEILPLVLVMIFGTVVFYFIRAWQAR
jgi:uncharacterized membrane protein